MSIRDFCLAFLAGAGATIGIQHAAPAAKPKPRAAAGTSTPVPGPKPRMVTPLPGGGNLTILDCPVVAPMFAPIPPLEGFIPEAASLHRAPPLGGGSGHRVLAPPPFSPSPAVPEPGAWAMLIAGFGLVGGRARRARRLLA